MSSYNSFFYVSPLLVAVSQKKGTIKYEFAINHGNVNFIYTFKWLLQSLPGTTSVLSVWDIFLESFLSCLNFQLSGFVAKIQPLHKNVANAGCFFYFLVLALKIKKATGCFCDDIASPLVLAYIDGRKGSSEGFL